jgi:hypothetical protein
MFPDVPIEDTVGAISDQAPQMAILDSERLGLAQQ